MVESHLPLPLAPEVSNLLPPKESIRVRLAKVGLLGLIQSYAEAGDYFKSIGAQTHNTEYGGSRSAVYYQMLSSCGTLREMLEARKEYKGYFTAPTEVHDEAGALLRIAAYKTRRIPLLGNWF